MANNLLRNSSRGISRCNAVAFSTAPGSQPVVELRQDAWSPPHRQAYWKEIQDNISLRQHLFPLQLITVPDTGGTNNLSTASHWYYYSGGLVEREALQEVAASHTKWQSHLESLEPCTINQHSTIFVEAKDIPGLSESANFTHSSESTFHTSHKTIFEYRRYQLQLGYDTVPQFLEYYQQGLPSKLETTHTTTSLVTVLYSEIGSLNQVLEVWRHGDGVSAMEASRASARQALEWRSAIAQIAPLALSFDTAIHRPVPGSPMQ